MNNNITKALPVLFGFFVMGFCDVVGISTSYVKQDFNLSETLAGFIPSMVFIWFLLLSIPAAMAATERVCASVNVGSTKAGRRWYR